MPFKLSANLWIASKKQLEDLTIRDAIWREEAVKITDRNYANYILGEWYVKYCLLFQKLGPCVDQFVQPQKRMTIKKLVDAAALRLLEFNHALRELDFSEYHYIDGVLVELKLVPYDVEILHPDFFCHRPVSIEEMWKKIQKGEKIFRTPEEEEELQRQLEAEERRRRFLPKAVISGNKRTSTEERQELERAAQVRASILLIQNAERGRQERFFYQLKFNIIAKKKKAKELAVARALGQVQQHVSVQTEEERMLMENAAAIIIQTYWRGYQVRSRSKYNETQRRLLIGMYETTWRSKREYEILDEALDKRREYRRQRLKEYLESREQEEIRILRVLKPNLLEDISDEIRQWFRDWYTTCNTFDKFPAEVLGGTCLIVRGQTLTPEQFVKKKETEKALGKKGVQALKAEKKKAAEFLKKHEEEKIKKEKALQKKKDLKRKLEMKAMTPDKYKYYHDPPIGEALYNEAMAEYKSLWDKRDEFKNPEEKHYMDLLTEEFCCKMQLECRQIVDQLMRIEYKLLQKALAKDTKKKYKNQKDPKPKKPKVKKVKDPTANRLVEEIFQELVDNGIIRTYPKVSLEDFHGDFSYSNWEDRQNDLDPPATFLDVRQAVVMNCIIPLGVDVMKKPKAVLISGPRQTGKHILANAVFNATKCVLFDLSPENTAGKYEGNDGMKMLLHLVSKMTKLLAPSIIFFDGAERIFYKRVPKEERKLTPKRLGKIFKNIVKDIKPEDKVMVLGISKKPFDGSGKLKKLYDTHILVPLPDYGSTCLYWTEILMAYPSIEKDFNITAIAKLTQNYPFSVLKSILDGILDVRRVLKLKNEPLTPLEIYNYILNHDIKPITEKEWKKFQKWSKRLPYPRKRTKCLRALNDIKEGVPQNK